MMRGLRVTVCEIYHFYRKATNQKKKNPDESFEGGAMEAEQ
jgi:hypothetical protein